MSLDIRLHQPAYCPHCEKALPISDFGKLVYEGNITHNLGKMAKEAGIYEVLWRPEEIGVTTARQVAEILAPGLERLEADPGRFLKWDDPNGWGRLVDFVPFCQKYLDACRKYPDAVVSVHR